MDVQMLMVFLQFAYDSMHKGVVTQDWQWAAAVDIQAYCCICIRSLANSEEFNKGLNRKASGLGALARSWKSGSEGQGPQK